MDQREVVLNDLVVHLLRAIRVLSQGHVAERGPRDASLAVPRETLTQDSLLTAKHLAKMTTETGICVCEIKCVHMRCEENPNRLFFYHLASGSLRAADPKQVFVV